MTDTPIQPDPDDVDTPDDDYNFDPPWLNQFLRALPLHGGNITLSMKAIGDVKGNTERVYRIAKRNPEFNAVFRRVRDEARTPTIHKLEDEYLQRLLEGDIEVTQEELPGGQIVTRTKVIRKAEPLKQALERMHPEKWAARELTPGGDRDVTFTFAMSDREGDPPDDDAEDADFTDTPPALEPGKETTDA